MIHITKTTKGKFMVVHTGSNGKVLNTSELLNSKQAAWKNIMAFAYAVRALRFRVQDETLKNIVSYILTREYSVDNLSKEVVTYLPKPKYIAGKNKKTVKKK